MKAVVFALVLCCVLWSAELKPNIAVMDLAGSGLSPTDLTTLSNRLRTELFETQQFTVVERGQMEMILKEQGFQQTGCTDAACAVEAGQLLNVEQMVLGSIDKIGRVHSIHLRLVNVGNGEIQKSVKNDLVDTEIEELVLTGIRKAVRQLAGLDVSEEASPSAQLRGRKIVKFKGERVGEAGSLNIVVTPADAEVVVDDSAYGKGSKVIDYVPAGAHKVRVERTGFRTLREKAEIFANQETALNLILNRKTPFSITIGSAFYFKKEPIREHVVYSTYIGSVQDSISLDLDYDALGGLSPTLAFGWNVGWNYFGANLYFFPGFNKDLEFNNAAGDTFYFETEHSVYGGFFEYVRLFPVIHDILYLGPGVSPGYLKRVNGIRRGHDAVSTAGDHYSPQGMWDSLGTTSVFYGGPTLNLRIGYKHVFIAVTDRFLLGIRQPLSSSAYGSAFYVDVNGRPSAIESKFAAENTILAALQIKF